MAYSKLLQRFNAGLTSDQIRVDAGWQKATSPKPKHFDEMSNIHKNVFRMMLDAKFPQNAAVMAAAVSALDF